MKRTHILCVALACGWLATSTPLFAQEAAPAAAPAAPVPNTWFTGDFSIGLLGRDDVDSSKFEEYRRVPIGVSMPSFSFLGGSGKKDFAIIGENVAQDDQRYFGYANAAWFGIQYDYNQTPHNMGTAGQVIHRETGQGVWSMPAILRQALGDAVDAVPTTARNYTFYNPLVSPLVQSAGSVDISSLRQRGNVEMALGQNTPFDVRLTYMRELKSGARGASGGDVLGTVTSAVDVPEVLDELAQDYGVRAAFNFRFGDVHAALNRNIYNDRVDSLTLDNPFRATDFPYTSTAAPGGPARLRFSTSPDNEATRIAGGAMLKFPMQTRISGEFAVGEWTQDAAFLPFTINSAIFTPSGAPATSLSTLPRASLDGKSETRSINVGLTTRLIPGTFLRARYRGYELKNKTAPISWLGGSTSGSPDRSWTPTTASIDAPFGYVTANRYNHQSERFDAQFGFEIKDLLFEVGYKYAEYKRTWRESNRGDETGYSAAAVLRTWDWLGLRAMAEVLDRSAKGWNPATSIGLQSDEAERETARIGGQIDLMPVQGLDFSLTVYRRKDNYPNRPLSVAGVAGTESGLLEAKFNTYTAEVSYLPTGRVEFGAYYTLDENTQTNRFHTLTSGALNNSLNYAGSDEGKTLGGHLVVHPVQGTWKCTFYFTHQEVDGLMDITAREAGSFYTPGRTTLIPPGTGGAADITDWDDTKLTTMVADIGYTFARNMTASVGYAYEKYTYADAFNANDYMFPQSVLFFMQGNDGGYKVNIVYAKLDYRF